MGGRSSVTILVVKYFTSVRSQWINCSRAHVHVKYWVSAIYDFHHLLVTHAQHQILAQNLSGQFAFRNIDTKMSQIPKYHELKFSNIKSTTDFN